MNQDRATILRKAGKKNIQIDLLDVLSFLSNHFRILAVCMLLGLIAGIGVYSYLPAKWRADITLQIGKVPVMHTLAYVDDPEQVVAKIKSPMFLARMAKVIYGHEIDPESPAGVLLYKDLMVALQKSSNLVTVNVFGWTSDEAYRNAGVIADGLIAEHQKLVARYMESTQNRLKEVLTSIAQNNVVLAKAEAMEKAGSSRNDVNTLLKLTLIDAKLSENQKLRAEQAELEGTMAAAKLQVTSVVGRSLPPHTPTSPKFMVLISLGLAAGLLLGLAISLGLLIRRYGLRGLTSS